MFHQHLCDVARPINSSRPDEVLNGSNDDYIPPLDDAMQIPFVAEDDILQDLNDQPPINVAEGSQVNKFARNEYCKSQYDFYNKTYGVAALSSTSKQEFQSLVNEAYENDDGAHMIRTRLYSFGVRHNLSREAMGELLEIIIDAQPAIKIPSCSKTLDRLADKALVQFNHILETVVEYPLEWEIQRWDRREVGTPPTAVHLRARDPIHCIAQQLINPELMLGYSEEHRHYRPYVKTNSSGDRVYSDLQSSKWAEETKQLLNEGEMCIPLILYNDGVTLNKVGRSSCEPVQGGLGIFSDEILRKPSAKICFGYIPSLEECFNEGLVMKHLLSRGHKKTQAEDMIQLFYYRIRSAFWDLLLEPIRAVAEGVSLFVLGKTRHQMDNL